MSQDLEHDTDMLIIIMGVSGAGKSTLGKALSEAISLPFVEGDDFHPRRNVDKLKAGHPLTDTDRAPWLELIRQKVDQLMDEQKRLGGGGGDGGNGSSLNGNGNAVNGGADTDSDNDSEASADTKVWPAGRGVIVSCSALKKSYRNFLRGTAESVVLLGEQAVERVKKGGDKDKDKEMRRTCFVFIKGERDVLGGTDRGRGECGGG